LARAKSSVSHMTRCRFLYSIFAALYCLAVLIPSTLAVMAVGRRSIFSFADASSLSVEIGWRKARRTPALVVGDEERMLV